MEYNAAQGQCYVTALYISLFVFSHLYQIKNGDCMVGLWIRLSERKPWCIPAEIPSRQQTLDFSAVSVVSC